MASKRQQQEADKNRVRLANIVNVDPSLTYAQQQRRAVVTQERDQRIAQNQMEKIEQARRDAVAGMQTLQRELETARLQQKQHQRRKDAWTAWQLAKRKL